MRKKFLLMTFLTLLFTAMGTSVLRAQGNVAKVGNTEYATIDEAIAAWTNNATLTLLADVTLSDVVTIKSTEHHILNLGTYTMTAASGKNAFVIQACGNGSAERSTITINADATNPGGINAGSKCIIYYKYADGGISTDDRPIIKINGGVFAGSTSSWGTAGIYTIGSAARKCATLDISGGTFNCSILGSTKSKLIVRGGVFNYSVSSQGDSTALRLISGGTFKTIGFMTADSNNTKFWIGTSMGNSNVGVCVDDNGYIVVGGPVVTEAGESFEASSANYSGASSYLQYSSAKDNGLYYTSVEEALADNNKTSGSVTVYVDELDMTGISYKGTIVVPADHAITITNADGLKVTDVEGNTITPNTNGTYTTVTPQGNDFTGYTRTDAIWGEVWGNAYESFVIKVLDANGNVMGTTSLNNIGGIIDGDVNVTWSLKLDAVSNTDEYWTMSWTTAPTIDNMPAKVELWVDGVKVSGGNVVLNGPDEIQKIYAAVTEAEGKILSYHTSIADAVAAITNTRSNPQGYIALLRDTDEAITLPAGITLNLNEHDAPNVSVPVAQIGDQTFTTLEAAFAAATEGQTITLLADATPTLISQRAITKAAVIDLGGKTLTLTEDDLYFGKTEFKNGNIIVDPSVRPSTAVFWMFANQTLTFDNVKLTATGVTGTYLIGLDGNNSDLNILNGSEIIVNNATALDLDIICVNASTGNDIVVDDSKVNIKNLDGRVFFRGNYTIKGDSDIDLDGITKAGFRIEAGQTLSIEDNATVDIIGEPRDGGIHLTDLTATYTVAETATVNATVNQPVAVAQIGTTKYGTLQAAIDAVQNGETIELLSDVTENVTLTEATGLYYTIDGGDKNMNGKITVNPLSDTNDNRRITISNINFVEETDANVDFISAVSTNHYPRLTISGCDFTGSGNDGDVAIRLKSSYSVVIENCTGTGLHSFLQNTSGCNLTINNVTVTNSKGGLALGTVQGVTVIDSNIDVNGYGIRLDAQYNNNAVIESNEVKAFIPVVVRKAEVVSSITFSGTNTMTASNNDGLWCAIGTSEYETSGTMPTAPTGQVTVTLNDTGLSMDGVYGNYYEFSGEGTAENPYLINNLYELKYFRDDVNGGNNYAGKYIQLNADIDLAGENWVGIGTATAEHGFMGNFDGKTFKIKNLTITNPALDSDGYAYAGLFGVTEGTDKDNQNTIKNLTIENVTISTTGHIVSAAIAYPYYTIVDNVKVCGNINITGGDYTAGVLAYTRRCVNASNLTIVGNQGSAITGNKTVGGVISDIQMNGGLTAVYNNFNAEGIKVKGNMHVGGISGIIAAQTLNTCSVKNVTLECSDTRVGIVSGSLGAPSTISNAIYENVTGATSIIGATFDGGKAVEAKIGDTYYASLQAALNAVVEGTSNGTVELISDIDLTDVNWTPVGTETKPFIGSFNGNEHTIKNLNIVETEAAEGKAYVGLFGYAKNTTIKNVVFENVNLNIACLDIDHSQGHIGAVAGSLEGTSTIENVTVKGDITVEATFDANGASRVAVVAGGNSYGDVTMKNVHVIANEDSYLKANNNVGALAGQLQGKNVFENCSSNINVTGKKFFAGGIIGLAAGDSQFKDCHTTGNVTITAGREGRANDQYRVGGIAGGWADGKTNVCTLTECSYTGQISGTNADGSVADPLDYAGYVGRGYTLANCAGSKVVIDGVEYVQAYDDVYGVYEINGVLTINTADALEAVAENPSGSVSIVLGSDITLTETIKINAGQTRTATDNVVTLDLNGRTITGTDNATGSFGLIEIQPGAELIINDSSDDKSGKITLTATNNREWNAYSSVISNQRGKLTVNGGTIEHLGGTDMAYAIDNLTNGQGTYAETVINGGTMKSPYRAIRQFLNGIEAQNILTVNGGTIEGTNKSIWMQDPSANANTGTLTVGENAQLKGDVYLYVTDGSTSWPVTVSIVASALQGESTVMTANVPAGYELKLEDGVYGVKHGVAKIGDVLYESLAEAATAATTGQTIELLWQEGQAPIAMNASLYGKNVTITGTATVDWSKGFLFVGRGGVGNATLTFDNAILTSASDQASTGIHVSGREKNTNNKYDGTVNINNSTIDLDYLINKGTMTLDNNSTLTVKNGFAVGGRPASETESGEDATATITLNNNSKVVVNDHNGMGLGYEAIGIMNINSGSTFETTQSFTVTAKGTMNVNGGNVKTVGTLTNNGTINVTGESTLNIEKLEGSSIDLNEGAIVKNSTVGGDAYIAGNVIFRGDNTFNMITDYGDYYSQVTPSMWTVEAGASLTLTKTDRYGLGYGDKVTVYGEIEDEEALTARASLTDEDASVNMYGGLVGMTNSAAPNAENSFTATNAYLIFGVNGDKSFGNKPGNYYGNYTFTFNNSVVTANGFKFYEDNGTSTVKFSYSDLLVNGVLMTNDASSNFTFENSVVLSMATSNGTDDKNQNAGVMTLTNTQFTYSAAFTNVGNLNIGENSTFTAPSVVNNGAINFTALSAKLDTDTEGLTIVDQVNNPDYKVVYKEGAYQFVQKVYVAQIGDVKFESLQEAVNAATNDATIVLIDNIEQADGVIINSKNIVVDLNENTFTVTEGASTSNRNFRIIGTSVVTIKNGTMVAAGNYSSGAYGTVRTEGSANVTLTGLKLYNYRGNGLNIKALAGTEVEIDNTEIYSEYGGGIEAAGGTITLAKTVKVEQKGMYTAPYNSMAISVNGGGTVTVDGGTYSTECITAEEANGQGSSHGPWVVGVLNSGGTLIINGGTFSNDNFGDNSLATAARGAVLADTKANVQINGGTFNALKAIIDITNNLGDPNNNPSALLSGGTFSADPRISGLYASELIDVADGYSVKELPNGYYTVIQTAGTQTRELPDAGWYWFSTYITYNNEETALDNLQAALGSNASLIKGQNAFTQYLNYYGTNFWTSDLTTLSTAKMYMIKTKADNVTVNLTGSFEDYANTNIELKQGWNWIGYPINEAVSLNDAIPTEALKDGDIIKDQTSSARYYVDFELPNGNKFTGWDGSLTEMKPGQGYMFKSVNEKTFSYTTSSNGARSTLNTVDYSGDNHWFTDATQYPNNMNIVAMMSIDGEIVKGNYEVAAFANGECRGSARPIYIEALDAYVLYMTIHGEDVAELTFKYYDVNYGTEYELDNRLTYSSDAILGSLKDPYIFTMNILGIGENSIDNINIYPNPTTTDREINLQAICDKVEVFNALGVKVAEYHNVDTLDALETAGIYVIRITNDNAVKHCRLVVK